MSLKKLASKVKKEQKENEKTFEERFIKSIDDFLTAPPKVEREQRLAFRPSQYYKCMRLIWYFLKGIKGSGKKAARSQRILQVGTALHEWIQTEVLMKMDIEDNSPVHLLPKEELPSFGDKGITFLEDHGAPPMEIKFLDTRWTEHFPISAMVDGGLTFMNQNFLFEFKTINPTDFDLLIEPLTDHIKQGAIYSLSTGVRQVMFLYLCKGTQNLKAYHVTYRQEQLDWVVERIRTIEGFVVRDELPPKEIGMSCKWCEYKSLCDKELKSPAEK